MTGPSQGGLLIINADDWGGWEKATDAAFACHQAGRITSVTAMMFMGDSERAAKLAKDAAMDVGLHVNLNQNFSGQVRSQAVRKSHERVVKFLTLNKYAQLIYHPLLRKDFRVAYEGQLEEFHRLYGQPPTHVDGHQHKHLCENMLVDGIIAAGEKVRRNFSFWPGEKSGFNRAYRRFVDNRLTRRYKTTDYFFSLEQCLANNRLGRVAELARVAKVELMTHPEKKPEFDFLNGPDFSKFADGLRLAPYAKL